MDHLITIYFGGNAQTTHVFRNYEEVVGFMLFFPLLQNKKNLDRFSWQYWCRPSTSLIPAIYQHRAPVRWDRS